MDKEILRIVIIATGMVVVVGMVLWSMFKSKNSGYRRFHFKNNRNPLNNIDPSLALHPEHDEFDIIPLDSPYDNHEEQPTNQDDMSYEDTAFYDEPEVELKHRDSMQAQPNDGGQMPKLIQFSLVAIADEGFNGIDLANAFDAVDLKYGNIKIYEKLDANGLVDFGVASMIEPGIFPDKDLSNFNCPGLVFFMQPREVDNPGVVFDDFIRTIDYLAEELGGIKWDHQKNPLTDQTVAEIRKLLY